MCCGEGQRLGGLGYDTGVREPGAALWGAGGAWNRVLRHRGGQKQGHADRFVVLQGDLELRFRGLEQGFGVL